MAGGAWEIGGVAEIGGTAELGGYGGAAVVTPPAPGVDVGGAGGGAGLGASVRRPRVYMPPTSIVRTIWRLSALPSIQASIATARLRWALQAAGSSYQPDAAYGRLLWRTRDVGGGSLQHQRSEGRMSVNRYAHEYWRVKAARLADAKDAARSLGEL